MGKESFTGITLFLKRDEVLRLFARITISDKTLPSHLHTQIRKYIITILVYVFRFDFT